MLRAAIRLKHPDRPFSRYVPKSPLVFDASKQITVYKYNDEGGTFRTGAIYSAVTGTLALSFELFVHKSSGAEIVGVLSALLFVGLWRVPRKIATAIHLQSDGSTVHLHTATISGRQSLKPIEMKIEDIRSEKNKYGYYLIWNNLRFSIDSNGHIFKPDLLFTILRGLPIEVAKEDK